MDYGLLMKNISRYVTLDEEEIIHLKSLLHTEKVKKAQVLLKAGEINSKVIFVDNGCLRSFATDGAGVQHVIQFAPPGWWMVDMLSFIIQEPSRLSIDAIEASQISYILKTDFDTLHLQIPKFERFVRILTMNGMANFQHRQIDNVSLPPIARYHNFCKRYPSLISRLAAEQIASYIGVSPDTMDELRAMVA